MNFQFFRLISLIFTDVNVHIAALQEKQDICELTRLSNAPSVVNMQNKPSRHLTES